MAKKQKAKRSRMLVLRPKGTKSKNMLVLSKKGSRGGKGGGGGGG